MAGAFHVEFGINETLLTRALELEDYRRAEKIIKENIGPSYLDEDVDEIHVKPRNLYLARLMVERGANVNFRVPKTYFGSEFMGPGKSALELLVDFYNDITHYRSEQHKDTWNLFNSYWDPEIDIVFGYSNKVLLDLEYVIDQVIDLVFIILNNGGDTNICDERHKTPLHKLLVFSWDIRLFKLLCEHGANVNATDDQGNTPLVALCDIATGEMYECLENLSPSSDDTLEDNSAALCVKADFLNYLLSEKHIDINIPNNNGQTALFHCMIRGDIDSCQKLLLRGADATFRGTVWESRKRKRKLSPLFVSFLSIPVQRTIRWQNTFHRLTAAPQRFAHLVDAGFFTRKEIAEELKEIIERDFPDFASLGRIAMPLIHMLFGRTTGTLQQLAARAIFQHCFIDNRHCLLNILPAQFLYQYQNSDDLQHTDVYGEYITMVLNQTVLQTLIAKLSLPQDSIVYFEAELLLQRMASLFSSFRVLPSDDIFTHNNEDSLDSEDDSDSSLTQDGGDSDLEYW